MPDPCNPFGLHTVTPYLVVDDVPRLMTFLREVFDARQRGDAHRREDGSIQHAEMQIGDSVLMMGGTMPGSDARPATLYVYVDDCDAAYRKALAAGATEVRPPADYGHGDRYGGVTDPTGNGWWVVTHIGKEPTEPAA